MTRSADLFICFSQEERAWVERTVADLESRLEVVEDGRARPFLCFYYVMDMHAGDDWHARMLEHAVAAHRFLLVVSPGSLGSVWCKLEVNQRIRYHPGGLDAMLCGNRLEKVEPLNTTAGFVLGNEVWADLVDGRSSEEQFEDLARWLCRGRARERFRVQRKRDLAADPSPTLTRESALEEILPYLNLVTAGKEAAIADAVGYAWFADGRRFSCDATTARAVAGLLQGGEPHLHWCLALGDGARRFSVAQVREAADPFHPGALFVNWGGILPEAPPLASDPVPFSDGQLGVVVTAEGQGHATEARPAVLHPWGETEELQVSTGAGKNVLPGAPLFDALGRFAGYVGFNSQGSRVAMPLQSSSS